MIKIKAKPEDLPIEIEYESPEGCKEYKISTGKNKKTLTMTKEASK